ncbi:MAG: DUF4465 domain-containing protein [Prolixibacteraceae bacterium]|jgi:hypothetical protein|nr:DUF4465 domain-containing protein [Prolixibacteraceae bacterium]MBT6005620.1 DUF4465 domain-containing protein [Prolixibacteraceae bacterium]MBT6767246.1 DUF4465 domain-containing protein [Prolixibacteraceae bacterium]MBT6999622.1 DUF4465 domain-containing protein [Prolixibacteraceae bacterium]MBT7393442.1 DUF4465 domain-containing protein [Prolixibacteraceae bacterium]
MKKFYIFAGLWVALFSVNAQNVANFEDHQIQTDSYWNGSDGAGIIKSGGFSFPNNYNADWGSWSGFSVSNMRDSTTAGWSNQYSAITASGVKESENYGVVYVSGELIMKFDDPVQLRGFYVTNATYTYLSMKNGDDFSKKFGGVNGIDPDFLKLIISGTDIYGTETNSVEFYLADFTFENTEDDYLIRNWEWVDLAELGHVTNLKFRLESTDNGAWGMNTPGYFCIDDFNGESPDAPEIITEARFEDLELNDESFYNGSDETGNFQSGGFTFQNSYNTDWASWSGFAAANITDNITKGWANQYSAIPGSGAIETNSYAVAYVLDYSEIDFSETVLSGLYITNSTYAYWAMKEGDDFSRKFGGENGSDPDWFKVIIAGISEDGDTTGTIEYYLSDFRPENNEEDFIVDDWRWIDVSSLGEISKLRFSLSSSDNGDWGMNTPAYFCIDQVNHQDLAPEIKNPLANIGEEINPKEIFYVPLDSVFTDPDNPDSEMTLKLEYIDNPELLIGSIVVGGKPGIPEKILLSLNVFPEKTGEALVTISATSNGKKVYHIFKVIVNVPVSAKYLVSEELNIYPNPVINNFFVELPDDSEYIILYNYSGQVLFQQNVLNEEKIHVTQIENSPSGIYLIKVKTEKTSLTRKLVKL